MFKITRGYKQGRAVSYYDITDTEGKTKEMIPKAEVVKLCTDGQVLNAKIQWWEGKAIVRCSDKQLPLVKVDDSCNIIGTTEKSVRNGNSTTIKAEHIPDVSAKAKVIGKINPKKRARRSTSYAGYDYKNLLEQQELSNNVTYEPDETIESLFDKMADEFKVTQKDIYKTEMSKKINLNKKLSDMPKNMLSAVQNSIAVYLMNMAHDEINEVYAKYMTR